MTNLDAFALAKKYIPGGVNSPVRAYANVGGNPPFIERGEGAYIYDIESKKYIDFVQSWGPLIFGHCDSDIENAIIKAVKNGVSFGAPTLNETNLAKLILENFSFLDQIRFVNSGTEATMSAIRLARAFSKKDGLIKFEGCYHGHSDALLIKAGSGATTFGNASSSGVPKGVVENTFLAVYNDISSVKQIFTKNSGKIGAVIIEPIAGNMGLVPANVEFLQELRQICDEFGAVLILDEVMSGYRASKRGSFEFHSILADIVTFGKVIGGGMNAAAFGAKSEIMQLLSPNGAVYQAGTLSGNPVAMSAGIATLTKINKSLNLYEKLGNLANLLMDGFKNAAKKNKIFLQTATRGSMFGYFFTDKNVQNYADALTSDTKKFALFHHFMLKNGIYLAPSQFETGFICDKMDEKMINHAIDAAYRAMEKI